jgi:hypothetical protein
VTRDWWPAVVMVRRYSAALVQCSPPSPFDPLFRITIAGTFGVTSPW